MSEIETGGRAFPWCGDLNETPTINLGLTVRDYMAAKAMASYLMPAGQGQTWAQRSDFDYIAESAYLMADAMIRARGAA